MLIKNYDTVIKLMKSTQKLLEHQTCMEAIDEGMVMLAHKKAISESHQIASRIVPQQDVEIARSWVELAFFSGFISAINESKTIKNFNKKFTTEGNEENWSFMLAHKFAFNQTEELFRKMKEPPVSPLVSNLQDGQLSLLYNLHERGLFSGYQAGAKLLDDKQGFENIQHWIES